MGSNTTKFHVYDSWDVTPPKVSSRSLLFHLKPVGIGTLLSESFTGYIARLARQHYTSVAALFDHCLAPASNKSYLNLKNQKYLSGAFGRFSPATRSLNGLGATANDWVILLESLTKQSGLRYLTMLRWQNVLSEKSLCRFFRAWCPFCYEEQRESGVVYDCLLWTLSTVEICPIHKRALTDRCPHCHRQLNPLSSKSRPGYCCRCEKWLGHSRQAARSFIPNELDYKLWIANQMGNLIAAAPTMASDPPQERATRFVPACINVLSDGNVSDFARLVNVNKITVYSWCYDRAVLRNDLLLKVCHATQVSLINVLTKDNVTPNPNLVVRPRRQVLFTPGFRRHITGEVEHVLLAALKQDPPPTVREIAKYLGYKAPDFLYCKYPQLCKMLTARYRNHFGYPQNSAHNTTHLTDEKIEHALKEALTVAVPPSIKQIARSLGLSTYKPRQLFISKFPELYRRVLRRRADYRMKHKEQIGQQLNAIMREKPPPTLDQVTKRLGYKANTYLRKHYPDLCRRIVERHRQYRKALFENISHTLEGILREKPPVSLRAAARRLGRDPSYLGVRFPEECEAIAKRYALFLKERSLKRKEEAAVRLREVALQLLSKGIYPSFKRIQRTLNGPCGLSPQAAGDVLRELRRKLKLVPPSRSSSRNIDTFAIK
jgi:hypothetical protein